MKIALIHYHLRSGGVTRVMEAQYDALEAFGHEVCLVSGDGESHRRHYLVPELDYCESFTPDQPDLLSKIQEALPWEPDLWLLHNPSLGKNIHFPGLIRAIAKLGTPVIFQIHDFAEDGRPKNYQLLAKDPCPQESYPIADHLHYAFINSRDRDLMIKAGLPSQICHLLPNAVNPPSPLAVEKSPQPLILYPVRGIRRKNLGEICLMAKHAPPGVRFAVTLAPDNPAWLPVHEEWVKLAQRMNLPVEFSVVSDERPFAWWLGHATHAVTTSVAEGFGLSFLEPALVGLPLFGRDLPEITKDFGNLPSALYSGIPVSSKYLDPEILKNEMEAFYQAYGVVLEEEIFQECLRLMTQGSVVDFGNLPELAQKEVLAGPILPELQNWLKNTLSEENPRLPDTGPWSIESYQKEIAKLTEGVHLSAIRKGKVRWLTRVKVLEQFLSPARFHFLRT